MIREKGHFIKINYLPGCQAALTPAGSERRKSVTHPSSTQRREIKYPCCTARAVTEYPRKITFLPDQVRQKEMLHS